MITDYVILNSEKNEFILEHLYTVDNYNTFKVIIKSGDFSGASHFCFSKEQILSILNQISTMNEKLIDSCNLLDSDSDQHIVIELDKLGHLHVFGQIGGSHEEQYMKFIFESDQTILRKLIDILGNC